MATPQSPQSRWKEDYLQLVCLLIDQRPSPPNSLTLPLNHRLISVLSRLPSADQPALDKLLYALAASPALWTLHSDLALIRHHLLLHHAIRNAFLARFAPTSTAAPNPSHLSRFLAAWTRALAPLSRSPPHALPALTMATAGLAALHKLGCSNSLVTSAEDEVLSLFDSLLKSTAVQHDRSQAVLSWMAAQVVPSVDSLKLVRSPATVPLTALLTRTLARLLADGRLFDGLDTSLDLATLCVRPGSATAAALAALSADPLCPTIAPIALSLATLVESTRPSAALERPLVTLAAVARRVHEAWRTATRSAADLPRFAPRASSLTHAEPTAADSWLKTVLFCTLAVLGGLANNLAAAPPPHPAPLVCAGLDALGALHFVVLRCPEGSLATHPQVLGALVRLAAQDGRVAQMVVEAAEPPEYGSLAPEPLGRTRAVFFFTLLAHLAPTLAESYVAKALEGVWMYLDRPGAGAAAHGALAALVGRCGPDTLCRVGRRYLDVLTAVPGAQPVLGDSQAAHAAERLFEALLRQVPSEAHKLLDALIRRTTLVSECGHRARLVAMLVGQVGVFGGQANGRVEGLVERIWALVRDEEEAGALFGVLERVGVPRNFGTSWWMTKTGRVGARL